MKTKLSKWQWLTSDDFGAALMMLLLIPVLYEARASASGTPQFIAAHLGGVTLWATWLGIGATYIIVRLALTSALRWAEFLLSTSGLLGYVVATAMYTLSTPDLSKGTLVLYGGLYWLLVGRYIKRGRGLT